MAKLTPNDTAEFWEGYAAFKSRTPCPYTKPSERIYWADGFEFAHAEYCDGRAWYKSRTVWVGAFLIGVGLMLYYYGASTGEGRDGGLMAAGFGGGLTANVVLRTLIQFWSQQPVMGGDP